MALQVFQQHQKYVAPPSKRWLNDRWCPVTFLRHKDTSSLQGAASIRSSPSILSITSVRAPCCWSPHCLEGETKSGEWHQPPPASHKQTFPLISSYFQHRPCSTAQLEPWNDRVSRIIRARRCYPGIMRCWFHYNYSQSALKYTLAPKRIQL